MGGSARMEMTGAAERHRNVAVSWAVTLSRDLNLTDRLYLLFVAILNVGLLLRPSRVSNWSSWLIANLVLLLMIAMLAKLAADGRRWRFLHEWYPLAMFIVLFEEVAQLS